MPEFTADQLRKACLANASAEPLAERLLKAAGADAANSVAALETAGKAGQEEQAPVLDCENDYEAIYTTHLGK